MTPAFKKERENLEAAATKLLSLALQAGAESAEVCGSFRQKTKITLEKQDYHMASADDGYSLGVRVLSGQRQGFASCNTTDLKELKEVALRAVEIAGFSPQNPNYRIMASGNIPKEAPSALWDDSLYQLSLQTQKDWTRLMKDEATKDPRFRLNEGGVEIASDLFLITNSHGTHKLEKETVASWTLMGMAVEGDVITSFDYFQEISRRASGVPERIVATTKRFRETLAQNLKQGPPRSYKGLVVFTPRAVIDILLSPLSYHLNGRNVVEKTSKWNLETLGNPVLARELTIRDLPWLTDRTGCAIFDREGTPTSNQVMIEDGMLRGFLMDQYAAVAMGQKSTGHAYGGPSMPPSVSPHCLCVNGGEEPIAHLIARATTQQKEFLVINRYSGQVDPVSGDFSGVAKGGEWWTGGERAYCVKETLISGNIFDAFGESLFGISKETEIVESAEECPTIGVNNVSVTGG